MTNSGLLSCLHGWISTTIRFELHNTKTKCQCRVEFNLPSRMKLFVFDTARKSELLEIGPMPVTSVILMTVNR